MTWTGAWAASYAICLRCRPLESQDEALSSCGTAWEKQVNIVARFMMGDDARETREVDDEWLRKAWSQHENILLTDGNTYRIQNVRYVEEGGSTCAYVELAAPPFARGG